MSKRKYKPSLRGWKVPQPESGHPAWCRVVEAHSSEDCRREVDLVDCPVCTPIVYAACAGCHGTGKVTPQDAAYIRVTLRR